MSVTYPRLVGVLALVWLPVLQRGLLDWPSDLVWAAFLAGWLAITGCLLTGRAVRAAGIGLFALASLLVVGVAPQLASASALWVWTGLILAVTEGRPGERALLVRMLVTSTYLFAAAAKLNPSFLAGEQLRALVIDRERWEALVPIMDSTTGLVLSWAAVAIEALVPVGLWWAPTRRITVVLAIAFHLVLIVIAFQGTLHDLAYITVLNMSLVVGYYAFFQPIDSALNHERAPRPPGKDEALA